MNAPTTEISPDKSLGNYETVRPEEVGKWIFAGREEQFLSGVGGTLKYGNRQIAIFFLGRRQRWYACQNLCPHKLENVIGRGLVGEKEGIPNIACPLHKKTFSLEDGHNLEGSCPPLAIYPVRVENGRVYVGFVC